MRDKERKSRSIARLMRELDKSSRLADAPHLRFRVGSKVGLRVVRIQPVAEEWRGSNVSIKMFAAASGSTEC